MAARKTPRDNFPKDVIRELRDRVGGICSNPDCGKMTLGPKSSDTTKAVKRGRAAHISAAAPGGPRYDADMSTAQRKSINNAIWLCTDCADMIDIDALKYPVSLLRSWKNKAENTASRQLGKAIPSHNEALNAFGILSGQDPFNSSAIISGVHNAYKQKLESIDPRFDITIGYVDGVQTYTFEAKNEPVCLDFNYEQGKDAELDANINDAFIHGGAVDVSNANASIKGSPTFELIHEGSSIQTMILGNSENITCQLEIFNKKSELSEFRAIAFGVLYRMPTGFTIAFKMFNEIVDINCKGTFNKSNEDKEGRVSFSSSISFHLSKWQGIDINELEYFDESFLFSKLLSEKNTVNANFILQERGAEFAAEFSIDSDVYSELFRFLEYWKFARVVAKYFEISIPFDITLKYSDSDLYYLRRYATIIENGFFERKDKPKKVACSLTFDVLAENIDELASMKNHPHPTEIKLCQNKHGFFEVAGVSIRLPRQEILFKNVTPKVDKKTNISLGNSVLVKFYPALGYSCQIRFLPDD